MSTKKVLPSIGADWLHGLRDMYIILSLKHSSLETAMFWQANCAGYTCSLVNAGKYSKEEIEGSLGYFNNGIDAIAIPCTQAAFETLGIFSVAVDFSITKVFLTKEISTAQ